MGENVCPCIWTQKLKGNSIQQSHFRQKDKNEFGNEINNGELKHLLLKRKKNVKGVTEEAAVVGLSLFLPARSYQRGEFRVN